MGGSDAAVVLMDSKAAISVTAETLISGKIALPPRSSLVEVAVLPPPLLPLPPRSSPVDTAVPPPLSSISARFSA
eukprot:CAMPEP_0171681340 /NCGR_PEP_ID=MMETSP0990-20121206/57317_1 /TAXON_ID=483369 /ORGANISM="non described non described, Strain CCMP2098" /LENGTH=74 /DNA_ID=CAMNT_0012268383 /DNA_START=573 /DNA_END=797 /DNA_ORIENTATION=-